MVATPTIRVVSQIRPVYNCRASRHGRNVPEPDGRVPVIAAGVEDSARRGKGHAHHSAGFGTFALGVFHPRSVSPNKNLAVFSRRGDKLPIRRNRNPPNVVLVIVKDMHRLLGVTQIPYPDGHVKMPSHGKTASARTATELTGRLSEETSSGGKIDVVFGFLGSWTSQSTILPCPCAERNRSFLLGKKTTPPTGSFV